MIRAVWRSLPLDTSNPSSVVQAVIPPNPNRHVPVVLMSNTLASAVAAESDIHIFSHAAEGERNIQDLCDRMLANGRQR